MLGLAGGNSGQTTARAAHVVGLQSDHQLAPFRLLRSHAGRHHRGLGEGDKNRGMGLRRTPSVAISRSGIASNGVPRTACRWDHRP